MKYMHIRQPAVSGWEAKGGITIAYHLEPKSRVALCGVSFCAPTERYCKKTGRSIAGGRLTSQPLKITMDGVITCFTIAQIVRTLLVEWEMAIVDEDMLRLVENHKPGQSRWQGGASVTCFSTGALDVPTSHRFATSWSTKLIGPDGNVALLHIDGNKTTTSGWINLVPLWARKVGWTWI